MSSCVYSAGCACVVVIKDIFEYEHNGTFGQDGFACVYARVWAGRNRVILIVLLYWEEYALSKLKKKNEKRPRRREETWWCVYIFLFLKYKDLHVWFGTTIAPIMFLNTPARISCTAIFMR